MSPLLFSASLSVLLAACGSAPQARGPLPPAGEVPRAPAPSSEAAAPAAAEPEAGSASGAGFGLAEAEAALAASENELQAQLGALPSDANRADQSADERSSNAPSEAPAGRAETKPRPAPKASMPESAGPDCRGACRALQSMKRAAERICALTPAEDQRCKDAGQRVQTAEQRVERAACACQAL